ncbi:MAG: 16S rRNA (adenine(1518)-N(6)/adenine(1519)-N(6))-dimethyltransferase RsmA [Cellvibrionaceae bacterium]
MTKKSASDSSPFQHRARKRFGQNFLNDPGIVSRIVRSIAPKPDDNIVEIGPGQGAITAPLLEACPKLQVIEIDNDLVPILLAQFAKYNDFKIHQQDALKFDFSSLANDKPLRIVGNLPYNISTPLIFHLLSFQQKISDMHFMLQKEVVERLAASAGEKHYGRLSIMTQYYCQVDHLFGVPPECFSPRPKVDSAIVRLAPFNTLPFVANDKEHFSHLVNIAFQQRRKTLRNTLKQILSKEQIDLLPIDTSLRPEKLSVEDYVNLSNNILELV